MLRIAGDRYEMRQVDTSALVWESPDRHITYRLETTRSEAEALRIAESIPMGTAK